MVQNMINEINGIITFMSPECKKKIPKNIIEYFQTNADILPEKAINPNVPIYEQDLDNQTLLMLAYLNKLIKK